MAAGDQQKKNRKKLLAKEQSRYTVKSILRQRRINAGLHYNIWWDGYEKKKKATWVLASTLGGHIIIPQFLTVACDRCGKWRLLTREQNPKLPTKWFCELNEDNIYNSCDVVEQDWEQEECSG